MSQENWPRTVCPSNVTVFGIGNKIKSQSRKVGQDLDERTNMCSASKTDSKGMTG
jgi:hypothetical protein